MRPATGQKVPDGLSRREFLAWTGAALLVTACGDIGPGRRPRIGLALGGGGARGLAHIPLLEALDELGIRPYLIAGTSIGAIIGALYASGLSGAEIRGLVEQFLVDEDEVDKKLFALPRSFRWLDFIDPSLDTGGLLDSSDFLEFLGEHIPVRRFRDLEIPLRIVAAELLSGEAVVLKSGDLLPAVQASMAVPGIFPPVTIKGRNLVDGGVVNPLPYDLLLDKCDLVIAIDVSGERQLEEEARMSFVNVLFHSFQIMSRNLIAANLRHHQPDIYIRPEIVNVRVLEFYKAKQVFADTRPAKKKMVKALQRALRRYGGRPGCSVAGG